MMTRSIDPSTKASAGLNETIQTALEACRQRGAQVTHLREAVLTALYSETRPVGAYDIKDKVSATLGRSISATSIYRTLDFLCEHDVAARIESRNAYLACAHPGQDHACILFICDDCGLCLDVENKNLEGLLTADAKALGFTIDNRVVELSGSCADCHAPRGS